MDSELKKAIDEYTKRFGETIPIFALPYLTDQELLGLIQKALESNKPIPADYPDKEAVY